MAGVMGREQMAWVVERAATQQVAAALPVAHTL